MKPEVHGTRTAISSGAELRVSWGDGESQEQVFTAAHIPADRWNGWAKPYFSQRECERLAATQANFNDSVKFEYDDARNVWQEFNEDEEYREDCRTIMVGGEVCHQIGSGFTWLERPDEPRHSAVESHRPEDTVRKLRSTRYSSKRPSTPKPNEERAGDLVIPGSPDTGDGLYL